MSLRMAERVTFLVECPHCGKGTRKMLAWLKDQRSVLCATPECGRPISLEGTRDRARIEKLFEMTLDMDRDPTQLEKL